MQVLIVIMLACLPLSELVNRLYYLVLLSMQMCTEKLQGAQTLSARFDHSLSGGTRTKLGSGSKLAERLTHAAVAALDDSAEWPPAWPVKPTSGSS